MIQQSAQFNGLTDEDLNIHFKNFFEVCDMCDKWSIRLCHSLESIPILVEDLSQIVALVII